MDQNLIQSHSIEINTSIEKVWHALTEPKIIAQYLHGTETITDWKVGSKITFQGEYEGTKYHDGGVIKEIIPNKKLSYTYWSSFTGLEDKPENYSLVTYDVEAIDSNKTKFTWTTKGYSGEKEYEASKSSMPKFLENIKSIVESINE
ncbi:MAG TPA: SRPBCC domain-containing protein [Bacteroidia bacterium]|nr:SRPBCC domain-containing protein [Bacteroidia bacterium]